MQSPKQRLQFITFLIIFITSLVAIIPFLLPVPAVAQIREGFQLQAVMALFFASFTAGSALLFLLGLKGFKAEFKKAYYLICWGLGILTISTLAFPIALYQGDWGGNLTTFGDFTYLIGGTVIYAGLSHFAKLVRVNIWFLRTPFMLVASILLSVLFWPLPHYPSVHSDFMFDFLHSATSAEIFISAFSAALAFYIRRKVSAVYNHALLWFGIAMTFNGIADAIYFSGLLMATPAGLPHREIAEIAAGIFVISKLSFITSGFAFNKINMQEKEETQVSHLEPTDVINYVASLASKPKEIDPILDQLRWVTANHTRGVAFSEKELSQLEDIYRELETYLIQHESLREFTVENLHKRLKNKFDSMAFVQMITARTPQASQIPIPPTNVQT